MSTCISGTLVDPRSIYPVFDLRRLPGPGPYAFGYFFALDTVQIQVQPDRRLPRNHIDITLALEPKVTEPKVVQGVNLFTNTAVRSVRSIPNGVRAGDIFKRRTSAQRCEEGVDTIVLCRQYAWPQGLSALYTFDAQDLWDFWGGCRVTFTWIRDDWGSGRWGNQTPPAAYPQVPNGSLMFKQDGTGFIQVFGDAGFPVNVRYLNSRGIRLDTALPAGVSRTHPGDGTLLREFLDPAVVVVYGGAKFAIPDPDTLTRLGYDVGQVGVVPPQGLAQLETVPFDGTLLKELDDPRVFLVESGKLRWIMSQAVLAAHFLPFRYVRTVPTGALEGLPVGDPLTV